ncbi:MAG TPA: hypothetical protein VJB08_00670 [Candidatus Nanoarchaeia archaeon]|nr:hypothetical protein [Candidatus Nanoarchaeia archaeon]
MAAFKIGAAAPFARLNRAKNEQRKGMLRPGRCRSFQKTAGAELSGRCGARF